MNKDSLILFVKLLPETDFTFSILRGYARKYKK